MAMDALKNDDLFQTSSGVGHHWRSPYYFPSSNFQMVIRNPVPPHLAQHPEITRAEHFKTTSGTAHDLKPLGETYGNTYPLFRRAPGHFNVHYNKDLHEKLQPGGWRRPLTMGNQASETHEEFRARPGTYEPRVTSDIRGFDLKNHMQNCPCPPKETVGDQLRGRHYFPKDKAILDLNDPYLTTTQKVHRPFTLKEHDSYPRKDAATFWECEGYPKAWGHGGKHNPIPKDSVPREPLPMRDEMVFKSATKIRRIPPSYIPVPHAGLRSEYDERYQKPSDVKSKVATYCPVDTPYLLPDPGVKVTYITPNMYKTEYNNVGSMRPLTV